MRFEEVSSNHNIYKYIFLNFKKIDVGIFVISIKNSKSSKYYSFFVEEFIADAHPGPFHHFLYYGCKNPGTIEENFFRCECMIGQSDARNRKCEDPVFNNYAAK